MPTTNAERKKKYLEKLKAGGEFEAYKQKKAANEKQRRERIRRGLELLPKAVKEKTKRLNNAYMRKKNAEYRQRKKGLSETTSSSSLPSISSSSLPSTSSSSLTTTSSNSFPSASETGYKTPSALYKAVGKLQRAMPSTTVKRKEAVSKLLNTFSEKDREDIVTFSCKTVKTKPSTRALSPTVIESVKLFYERDDISRMSPNTRDCRKFVNPVTDAKEVKQIRYLMYKIMDVYHLFLKHVQNGDDTVAAPLKSTKFFELRPEHVKLVNSTPLETCFCLYHSNFIMCCQAIRRCLAEFPKYGTQLEKFLLCDIPKENCWLRKCSLCSNAKIREKMDDIVKRSGKNLQIRLNWKQWAKNKETNRFQKHVVPGTFSDLQNHFFGILTEFLKHSHVKRCQAATFENDSAEVKTAKGKMVIAQIDFAESFNCEAQEEIQSAHWNQANV